MSIDNAKPEEWNGAKKDMVNHPPHYCRGKIEVLDAILDWCLPYCLGNVVKYIVRSPYKGNEIEDLKKAQFYFNRHIVELEREPDV